MLFFPVEMLPLDQSWDTISMATVLCETKPVVTKLSLKKAAKTGLRCELEYEKLRFFARR